MARITSSVGLVSGIDTTSIVNAYLQLDRAPVTDLQTRMGKLTAEKTAFTTLSSELSAIQKIGTSLQQPDTFTAATATSSDNTVLTATAGASSAVGSYQIQVARLVSNQQSITNGYASTSALVGAGNLTIEMGGGNLDTQTSLAQLNGGAGVSAGQFRITDASGKSNVIDTSSAITLDDVVKQINTSLDISVKASIQGDHLVLTDTSGGVSNPLTVRDMGAGTTAQQLGIAGAAPDGLTIAGTNINSIGSNTALASLNDGLGVRKVSTASSTATGPDFSFTFGDGSTVNVALGDDQTIGQVIDTINKAGAGKVKAAVGSGGTGLSITDTSGAGGSFSVTALNGSGAAADLGILQTGSGGIINGSRLIAGLDSTLVSSLKGGAGVALGQLSITDRAGTSTAVDLSGAKSVQDILDTINSAASGAAVKVTASLNSAGDGISLSDSSGGSGNLVVSDGDSNKTATALGLAGSFDTTVQSDEGSNLQHQWINENSLLSKYNGGKGVTPGSFKITNSSGAVSTVDLSKGTYNTLGDVIAAINDAKAGVTATVNANGNGLLLTDTARGKGKLTISNVSGTTATDLHIAGTASDPTGTILDGSFEKTIAINAADTLQTVQNKIQQLGFGVGASIINDGTAGSPYRLSLTAINSGKAGRVMIDAGATSLKTHDLVQAQDAAMFLGGTGSAQPLLITSSTDQVTNVIPGVTINLTGVSKSPVSLNVARDPTGVATQLGTFVSDFNALVDQINSLTSFNTATNTAGLLLGDPTLLQVQAQMYGVINTVVNGAGKYKVLADIGVTVTDGAKLSFNKDAFTAAAAADPTAVSNLFTQTTTGLGTVLANSMTVLTDPVTGLLTQQGKTIDSENQQFQDQVNNLNQIIAQKQQLYQEQFANMETTLSTLQGQSSFLSSIAGTTTSGTTTSSGGVSSAGTSSTTAASPPASTPPATTSPISSSSSSPAPTPTASSSTPAAA